MQLPYHFPDPLAQAARVAAEFQRLSPDERWREIASLMEFGHTMTQTSERRAWIEARQAQQEAQWQQIQRELIARHGQ
jgi:hypothetical protein